MKTELMTPNNKRWDDFMQRLEGIDGLNFNRNKKGKLQWTCHRDYRFTKKILKAMGKVDIKQSYEYYYEHGARCDCMILFNIDPAVSK